jgi:integrase
VKAQIRLRNSGKRTKKDTRIYKSDLKFHHLRHTALSWLGDTGASDMVIKAIAGHADSNVTDRYMHVSLDTLREAIERLERAKLLPKNDQQTAAEQSAEVG